VGLPLTLAPAMPVAGVELVTLAAGIKTDGSADLVLARLDSKTQCAAVFTQNAFCAAPVEICKQHLIECAASVRALIINAGNANAGTGKPGIAMALGHCNEVASALSVPVTSVLPFSTGVIGQLLPDDAMRKAIATAGPQMDAVDDSIAQWQAAAHAIMTTDTQPKLTSQSLQVAGEAITITGFAKGAGMIQPDMATMLSFIFTDAAIDKADLQQALREAVEVSFNAITVDSDTSTNDSCVLLATGCGKAINRQSQDWPTFITALKTVCTDLAQAIIRDAEGASKFISVHVRGGRSVAECKQVGYAVANSPLVKTAMFASDANVGRLLMAIGKAGIPDFDTSLVRVSIGDVLAFESAGIASTYTEAQGAEAMAGDKIDVVIDLGRGDENTCIYTSDLSHDYVSINADYRT
jgi:glutamate N-acetyltransferase/amino-acid N-acetyltransferase